jgi:hypothetical protein
MLNNTYLLNRCQVEYHQLRCCQWSTLLMSRDVAYTYMVPQQEDHTWQDQAAQEEADGRTRRIAESLDESHVLMPANQNEVNCGENDDVDRCNCLRTVSI